MYYFHNNIPPNICKNVGTTKELHNIINFICEYLDISINVVHLKNKEKEDIK
jgi:hypothetical protein